MNMRQLKKYFIFVFLFSVIIALSGCSKNNQEAIDAETDVGVIEDVQIETEPVMTEVDLDKELTDLDQKVSELETTGFESDTLSEVELGL